MTDPATTSSMQTADPAGGGSDVIISVRDLSKVYRLYDRSTDRLKEALHPLKKKYHREFHALKDVSFDVRRGETVGIVGRNGAGKSTLLQLICGTLSRTSGEVVVHGKISPLLALGVGFSPEYTGRENVYLNAAILGLSSEEIDARCEQIAEFAGIGDFMDQPVRIYSSGMRVRIAFAVAIHVSADILVVDEALAVGDEVFQRKCFGHIEQFRRGGGTILFVSHSAGMVVDLCDRAVLLDRGEQLLSGSPKTVVAAYHKMLHAPRQRQEEIRNSLLASEDDESAALSALVDEGASEAPESQTDEAAFDPNLKPESTVTYESQGALICNARIATPDGRPANVLTKDREYVYSYDIEFDTDAYGVRWGTAVKSTRGVQFGELQSHVPGRGVEHIRSGQIVRAGFPFRCALIPGTYYMNAGVVGIVDGMETYLHRVIDVVMFKVLPVPGLPASGLVDLRPAGASEPEYCIEPPPAQDAGNGQAPA